MLIMTAQVALQMASLPAVGWTTESKLALAASPAGRIVLHVVCAWRDRRFRWHWQGVRRELVRA